MSYKNIPDIEDKSGDINDDNDKFIYDIIKRKEFYSLKGNIVDNFRETKDNYEGIKIDNFIETLASKHLKIHSHQLFVSNFMNPNTPYKRLLLKHSTGSGKTLAAISIALKFIEMFRAEYETEKIKTIKNTDLRFERSGRRVLNEIDLKTPNVYVIGFARGEFIKNLLKFPELGFISISEKQQLDRLRTTADKTGQPSDIKLLKEFYGSLKKRISNKSKGGFFKFYGYQEFVNRLFDFSQRAGQETINLTDLENIVTREINRNENKISATSLEDIIRKYIDKGLIRVNERLLDKFKNSIIICDEIHNVYNSIMKNNWGIAIQYVLDKNPNVRAVFMSATPINNSPTEVVDLMNLLLPEKDKISKREYFKNNRELYPGKLEKLGQLSVGRVSFLQDINLKYYPERIFIGEIINIPESVRGNFGNLPIIPYLKFTPCKMSELHQITYNYLISQGSVPADGYTIYDMVFPNPDAKSNIGLFKSAETRGKLLSATEAFKKKYKITTVKYSKNVIITGDFLKKSEIGKYSTKYEKLITEILDNIGSDKNQKTMIYHNNVKMSGVLLLQELLRVNGFIDEYSEPASDTICALCGICMAEHKKQIKSLDHEYYPARFVVAHSDIDRKTMENSINKFNSPTNAHGNYYKVLIGSKIIKESIEIKDVQNLYILTLPVNIPTLIQVFGRCIRKNSHINLPVDQRKVNIRILISTINKQYIGKKPIIGGYNNNIESYDNNDIEGGYNDQTNNDKTNNSLSNFEDFIEHNAEIRLIEEAAEDILPEIAVAGGRPSKKTKTVKKTKPKAKAKPKAKSKAKEKDIISEENIITKDKNKRKQLKEEQKIESIEVAKIVSLEEQRYIEKLKDYIVIQNIEKILNENAVDAFINRDVIMSPALYNRYFQDSAEPIATIGDLYFEPKNKYFNIKDSFTLDELSLTTFTGYKYFVEEIETIVMLIKRLFIMQPIWTYDDLFEAVKNPPFGIETNPRLFSEDNFIIALNHLETVAPNISDVQEKGPIRRQEEMTAEHFANQLFDNDMKYIYIPREAASPHVSTQNTTSIQSKDDIETQENNETIIIDDIVPEFIKYKIEQVGDYHILFPVQDTILYDKDIQRDSLLKRFDKYIHSEPIVDIESFQRKPFIEYGHTYDINTFVNETHTARLYNQQKKEFIDKFKDINIDSEQIYDYFNDFNKSFQIKNMEEMIEYMYANFGNEKDKKTDIYKLYTKMLRLLNEFGIIIFYRDVKKYKDVLSTLKNKLPKNVAPCTPMGYVSVKCIKLLDKSNWISVNKNMMGKNISWNENKQIVGYFESSSDGKMHFKLRKPIQMNMARGTDSRLIETGSICTSKSKTYLVKIANEIKAKYPKDKIRVQSVCIGIRNKLLDLERKERMNNTNKKYVYLIK